MKTIKKFIDDWRQETYVRMGHAQEERERKILHLTEKKLDELEKIIT